MPRRTMKICFIFGTRPEIIKLYSVMNAAIAHKQASPIFIHTGQHYDYEMSQVFLEELKLPQCHHFLNIRSGPHGKQTASLMIAIEKALKTEKPDTVVVMGDTNTTLAGALAATKLLIPVAHVEAGCRSFDLDMPEEINRLTVDAISSILFAPSNVSAMNLLFEGKSKDRIFLAGNTVVDIVEETQELRKSIHLDEELREWGTVVVTLHRQENVDDKSHLKQLLQALAKINESIVFPIHPRTRKRIDEFGLQNIVENIPCLHLVKPLRYLSFMKLLEKAKVVITDSGGVQEEAIMVGTPCVTARDTTEWPETVWAGGNYLAGRRAENVTKLCHELLAKVSLKPMPSKNPFKGNAGPTIVKTLIGLWTKGKLKPPKPDMTDGKYPLPSLIGGEADTQDDFYTTLRFDREGQAIVEEEKTAARKVVRRNR
ncbi:MAG: non-hydrolyzing UDP-N-acetylglucosamine 2-epimerase [Promethearchaeota archaeon]